ncbi:MAG: hypothetical protein LUF92_01010 [Clostridiales bacterium]|nr:hypothetical protein [Clostridiales bacterium]
MAKCFLTYEQQIDNLINEKGLLIADCKYAEDVLKRTSYNYFKVFIAERRFSGVKAKADTPDR